MKPELEPCRSLLHGLVETLARIGTDHDDLSPGHGTRVAELALALADAAARREGAQGEPVLSADEREAVRLAATIHGMLDADGETRPSHREPRLSNEALAAVEYRLRWIRETCRHRATVRSVFDGGGFCPPPDPAGLAATDYALRAGEVEGLLEFLARLNGTGPETAEDRERLAAIARRTLETGDGPPVPYLTESEHALLTAREPLSTDERRASHRRRVDDLLERLDRLRWPEALTLVPELVRGLLLGVGRGAPPAARLLAVAETWDRLMRRGGPEGQGIPAEQVLSRLRREAAAGHLDGSLVEILAASGLLPSPESGGTPVPRRSEGREDRPGAR